MQLQIFILVYLVLGTNKSQRGSRGGRGGGGWPFGIWRRSSRGGSSSSYGGSSGRPSSSSSSSNSRQSLNQVCCPLQHLADNDLLCRGGWIFHVETSSIQAKQVWETQYFSFSKPMQPIGKYAGAGGAMYGYRIGEQGTNWRTSFRAGTGKFKGSSSKKALGLGVAASCCWSGWHFCNLQCVSLQCVSQVHKNGQKKYKAMIIIR